MTVPLARGLATCTTSWTDEDDPAFSAPMFRATTPTASIPPAGADTKAVFAGIVSVITTPLALALPVFEYDSVYVMLPPAFTGSGASVFEIERTGADDSLFFFNDTAATEISSLSLHDAPPILTVPLARGLATCTTSWTDEDDPTFSA